MTTKTIPLNITRHTYDGTPETLPPLEHKGRVSEACLVFFGGARQPTRACLVKEEEELFWMVGADIYPPLPGDIWFYAYELDPILTATTSGLSLIATAQEQRRAEGYDAEDDAEHRNGELAWGACYYAMPRSIDREVEVDGGQCSFDIAVSPNLFYTATNWDLEFADRQQKTRIKQLAAAGALIVAELDRLLVEEQKADE